MKSILQIGIILMYFSIETKAKSNSEEAAGSQTIVEVEFEYTSETSPGSHSQATKTSNTSLSKKSTSLPTRIPIAPVSKSSRRERRRQLFDRMVEELGDRDPIKIQKLTTAPDSFYREMNSCFMESYDTFMRFCRLSFMGGGVKYFKLLLSVACESDWLTAEKICSTVRRTCQPRLFGLLQN